MLSSQESKNQPRKFENRKAIPIPQMKRKSESEPSQTWSQKRVQVASNEGPNKLAYVVASFYALPPKPPAGSRVLHLPRYGRTVLFALAALTDTWSSSLQEMDPHRFKYCPSKWDVFSDSQMDHIVLGGEPRR